VAFLQTAEKAMVGRVSTPTQRATLLLLSGKASILEQEYARARDRLAQAVALPGTPAEAHFWYAESLAKTKTPGASESYAKYLELAPRGYYAGRAKKALSPR